MSRAAAVLALLLIVAAPAVASTPPQAVWTVFTTVEADVVDHYATVRVVVDIGNRGPDPEFPFVVHLPDAAYVTGLTITRDGETHEARIEERAAARAEYEAQKAIEQTGALVEKQRNSQLFAYLINTAAFDSVRAVLTYEHYIQAERGVHALDLEAPVSGFGQDLGARFDVRVAHSDGVQALWGDPSGGTLGAGRLVHEVGPRTSDAGTPFHVAYTVGASPSGTLRTHIGDEGSFVHRFSAPPDDDELPLDLVLVLDTSGSMRGEKILQLRDAGQQLVQILGPEDRVHLVPFSTETTSPWQGFLSMGEAGRRTASGAIDGLIAAGSTNIEDGLRDGLAAFEDGADGVRVLVLLTDGMPTVGIETAAALRELARGQNTAGATIYGIAFGADADWPLIAGLAEDGGGMAVRVEDGAGAEVDLRRFLQGLAAPALRDLKVQYSEGVHAHTDQADVLFAGSEVLFTGTFPVGLERIEGTVTATAADGPRSYRFSMDVEEAGPAQVGRNVAYQRIRALEQEAAAGKDVLQELTALAVRHGFVTDHTSLVVTLPASELRAFDPTAPQASRGGGAGGSSTTSSDRSGTATTATATSAPTTTATSAPTTPATGNVAAPPADGFLDGEEGLADGPLALAAASPDPEEQAPDRGTPLGSWTVLLGIALAIVLARRR